MEDKTQAAGGQDGEPERVEQPITDEQLEVAFVELSARVARDVAAIFRAKRLLIPADELREAVQYAFGEAAIRRPGHPRPRAWLTTVAYRYAVNARLKQRREIEAATVLALLGDDAIHHGRRPAAGGRGARAARSHREASRPAGAGDRAASWRPHAC